MTEQEFRKRLRVAFDYVNKIVVESDGYPMLHSAADIRTLLANAHLEGQKEASGLPPSVEALQRFQNDWRILRARNWDWHDQHLIVRPFVDELIAALPAVGGPPLQEKQEEGVK